jgi:hypothetical protein
MGDWIGPIEFLLRCGVYSGAIEGHDENAQYESE